MIWRRALALCSLVALLAASAAILTTLGSAATGPVARDEFTSTVGGWSAYNGDLTLVPAEDAVKVSRTIAGDGFFTFTDEGDRMEVGSFGAEDYRASLHFRQGSATGTATWKLRSRNSAGVVVHNLSGPSVSVSPSFDGVIAHTFPDPIGGWPAGGTLEVRLSMTGYGVGQAFRVLWVERSYPNAVPPPPNQSPTIAWDMDNDGSADVPQPSTSTVTEDTPITYRVLASDPDSDPTTVNWDDDTASPPVFDDGTGTSFTKTYADPGEYEVGARVTDNRGGSSEIRQFVTVEAGPPPPPAEPGPVVVDQVTLQGSGCLVEFQQRPAGEAVDEYQIYKNSQFTGWHTEPGSATQHLYIPAVAGDNFRMSAHNSAGYGPWGATVNCVDPTPPPPPACSDGLDNDGDGLTDFPADPGCSGTSDTDETDAPPPPPPGGVFEDPFVNSKLKVPASQIGTDPNSGTQTAIIVGALRNVNSGRGPTVFNGGNSYQGLASHRTWQLRGTSVGGTTLIKSPEDVNCTGGVDPTVDIFDESSGKIGRLYGGDSGSCSKFPSSNPPELRGQNLGVDTNRDAIPEQGIGTAAGFMSEATNMRSLNPAFNEGVGLALGNNLNDAGGFRSPAIRQEGQATGPNYPAGVQAGTRVCHNLTDAQINSAQASAALTAVELAVSDTFWIITSCNGPYGRGIWVKDGTGTNGANLYFRFGANRLNISETQARHAVRLPANHNAGGQANQTVWATANWMTKAPTF